MTLAALWGAVVLLLPMSGGGGPVSHDLHIVYADLALEGGVVAGRIRFFQDDLERALGARLGASSVALSPGAEADALVVGYVRDHLRVEADGVVLAPELLDSGRDELDREAVWWVLVQFPAAGPVESLRVRNRLLFEVFGDQRNIMKFVRFPDRRSLTFYFAEGEDEHLVRFDRPSGMAPG